MMTHRLRFEIVLAVKSPFLFRGLEGKLVGVDVAHIRDEDGVPLIPSDQVRGVFREAFGDMVAAGVSNLAIQALFGSESPSENEVGGANEPARGKIHFADLIASEWVQGSGPETTWPKDSKSAEWTRVEIDDDLGAARSGHMQIVELVAPFGSVVLFRGEIVLFAPQSDSKTWEQRLNQAVALTQAIGAFKSPGFGEIDHTRSRIKFVSAKPLAVPATAAPTLPEADRIRLDVLFDRPILVDSKKIAGNALEGSDIIPGAVFKGAIAERIRLAGDEPETGAYAQVLSALLFSHAFPSASTGVGDRNGGWPLPLCLVAEKVGESVLVGDALGVPIGSGAFVGDKAGLFQSDWKPAHWSAAAACLGRPDFNPPAALARTRIAIDPETGTAKQGALFSTIAKSVRFEDGTRRPWILDVDLGKVEEAERPLARRLLQALIADGLDGIGRTGAHATFERPRKAETPAAKPYAGQPGRYAVMLVTPALMLDPSRLMSGTGWAQSPLEAYADYFGEVLPGAKLVNAFAAQEYKGGYLARRRRLFDDGYFPFLLTVPGSVFLLETSRPEGLEALLRFGLPLPRIGGKVPTWRNCPYVPENGYGRITTEPLASGLAKVTAVPELEASR